MDPGVADAPTVGVRTLPLVPVPEIFLNLIYLADGLAGLREARVEKKAGNITRMLDGAAVSFVWLGSLEGIL